MFLKTCLCRSTKNMFSISLLFPTDRRAPHAYAVTWMTCFFPDLTFRLENVWWMWCIWSRVHSTQCKTLASTVIKHSQCFRDNLYYYWFSCKIETAGWRRLYMPASTGHGSMPLLPCLHPTGRSECFVWHRAGIQTMESHTKLGFPRCRSRLDLWLCRLCISRWASESWLQSL